MVTFRCKRSGNTVSFTNPDDIAQLRIHEGYEEVKNGETKETTNADERPDEKEVLTDLPLPLRNNGKVDKRSLAYRKSTGRS